MTEYHADLDPEELEPCPYDNAHMIRRKRMQYHLMKCKKNHPGNEFKTCPFNACHEMPGAEYRYHLATCPDRNTLEKDIAYARERESGEGSQFKGCTDVPAYNSYDLENNENWDDDINPNPRIGVHEEFLSKVKFKNITGLTPAEKRHFHRTLNPEHPEPASTVQVNKENEIPNGNEDGKLRLPKNTSKAFSMYQSQTPAPHQTQQPSTVFQYSLAQCGIGRGRAASALGSNVGPVGRGRGIGSLVQSGMTAPPAAALPTNYSISSIPSSLSSSSVVGMNYSSAPLTNGFTGMTAPANVFSNPSLTMPIGRGRGVGRASPSATNGFSLPSGALSNGQKTDTEWPSLNSSNVFSPNSGLQNLQGSSPAYVVPKVNSEKVSQSPQKKNWYEYTESDSGSGADGSSDTGIDEAKKRKQVQKKLRQVMALEAKEKSGVKLNPDEETKLSQKFALEQQLAALSL